MSRTVRAGERYVAQQGTAPGRAGKVFIEKIEDDIWVGGEVVDGVVGTVDFPG